MRKLAYYILLFILQTTFLQNVNSQAVDPNRVISGLNNPNLYGEIWLGHTITVGSPFLFDEWVSGDVILSDGKVSRGNLLKYDGLNDQILWFNQAINKTILLSKSQVKGFNLYTGSDTLQFKSIENKSLSSKLDGQFVQVLYQDKLQLVVNRKVEQTGIRQTIRNGKRVEFPILSPVNSYCIIDLNGNSFYTKKINRSFLNRTFPEFRELIKQKISKESLRLDNEENLISLFEYIESLY